MTWEIAFSRLGAVRDELEATRFSLDHVQRAVEAGRNPLPAGSPMRPAHIRQAQAKIEITYTLRVFAEFESILRDYWNSVRPRSRRRMTRMEILIDRVAILSRIPFDNIQEAHRVREFRNAAVHDAGTQATLTFQDCKARLGTFLSYLPTRW